jgi:hypothetical protein
MLCRRMRQFSLFAYDMANECVAWVERSDTQEIGLMGIAMLNPSYEAPSSQR